jgi:hypothetical protein
MPLTALLSREVEGTALRNLGNRAALCAADGANSGRWVLEDERAIHYYCPFLLVRRGSFC